MADYDFDEDSPGDDSVVSDYPANARAQRGAVKGWADVEHTLAGRHQIPNGSGTGARPATDLAAGVWYLDTTAFLLELYSGTAWSDLGFVGPGDMIVTAYSPASPRRGWLACNGQAVSTTTYARLFAAIGSTYDTQGGASAPGAGLFRVPNMASIVPMGFHSGGDADGDHGVIGIQVGNKKVTIAQENLPDYELPVTDPGHDHSVNSQIIAAGGFESGGEYNLGATVSGSSTTGISVHSGGSGTALDVRPKALVLGWLIKT